MRLKNKPKEKEESESAKQEAEPKQDQQIEIVTMDQLILNKLNMILNNQVALSKIMVEFDKILRAAIEPDKTN
jgi:hypothetical protein